MTNTYDFPIAEDVEIVVGDEKQAEFLPRMKIKRWDNEVNFSVGVISEHAGVHERIDGRVDWIDGHGVTARFYERKPIIQPTAPPETLRHINLGAVSPNRMAALYELPIGLPTIITYTPDRDCFVMYGHAPLSTYVHDTSVVPAMRYRGYAQSSSVMFGDRHTFVIDVQFDDTVCSADAVYDRLSDAYCKTFDLTGHGRYYNAAGEKVATLIKSKDHVVGYLRLSKINRDAFLPHCTDTVNEAAAGYAVGGLGIDYDTACKMLQDTFASMHTGALTSEEERAVADIEAVVSTDDWVQHAIRPNVDYVYERNVMETRHQRSMEQFEFEIELAFEPADRRVEMSIETKGLDFLYQPFDVEAGSFRPENVKGSYAVYHKSMQGGKYHAGKAFHIYRPYVTDANGEREWCELKIVDDVMQITVPANITYPAVIDPTFGCSPSSPGASWEGMIGNILVGSLFTSPTNIDTAQSISCYVKYEKTQFNMKGTIVLHSNLNIISNGIGAASPACTSTTGEWLTSSFGTDPDPTNSTEYVLMMVTNTGLIDGLFAFDSGDVNQGHQDTTNFYISPINPTDATHINYKYSIYCTYTETGAGISIPVVMHHLRQQGIS